MRIRHYLSFWTTNKWKRSVRLKYTYGYVSISLHAVKPHFLRGIYIFFYASKLLFTNCWQGSYWRTTKGVLKKSEQRNRRAVPTKIGIVDQSSLQRCFRMEYWQFKVSLPQKTIPANKIEFFKEMGKLYIVHAKKIPRFLEDAFRTLNLLIL